MAGTDRTREPILGGPVVVLVKPQLAENIGAAARAMLNFGLTEMRLVSPRDGWPNPAASAMASRADAVLDGARAFGRTEEAIADLHLVLAATARRRDMIKPVLTPARAAAEMRAAVAAGRKVGVLFGAERSGLDNEDVVLANAVVQVPCNPAFSSLNLAQAVLLVGYEWFQAGDATPGRALDPGDSRPATSAELVNFFERLEPALDEAGFLFPPEKRPAMVRNVRNLFQRAGLTEQEVRTLHGILSALTRRRGG